MRRCRVKEDGFKDNFVLHFAEQPVEGKVQQCNFCDAKFEDLKKPVPFGTPLVRGYDNDGIFRTIFLDEIDYE